MGEAHDDVAPPEVRLMHPSGGHTRRLASAGAITAGRKTQGEGEYKLVIYTSIYILILTAVQKIIWSVDLYGKIDYNRECEINSKICELLFEYS